MDRISALRNVEDALSAFERGNVELETTEARITATIRTYATSFERGAEAAYRVEPISEDALIVVASSPEDAEQRAETLLGEEIVPERIERLPE